MKYTVIFHRTEEGISVSVPGLPGCWSEGDTEEEALENIQDIYFNKKKESCQHFVKL
jgi:predicted RNase H-like HicB family nuclease